MSGGKDEEERIIFQGGHRNVDGGGEDGRRVLDRIDEGKKDVNKRVPKYRRSRGIYRNSATSD